MSLANFGWDRYCWKDQEDEEEEMQMLVSNGDCKA